MHMKSYGGSIPHSAIYFEMQEKIRLMYGTTHRR